MLTSENLKKVSKKGSTDLTANFVAIVAEAQKTAKTSPSSISIIFGM